MRTNKSFSGENIPRVLEMGKKALDLLPDGDVIRVRDGDRSGKTYWALGDVIQSKQVFGMAQWQP